MYPEKHRAENPGFLFTVIIFIYLFLERGEEREKERERNIGVLEIHPLVASQMPPAGDLVHNPGMCPDLGIEPVTFWLTGQSLIQ